MKKNSEPGLLAAFVDLIWGWIRAPFELFKQKPDDLWHTPTTESSTHASKHVRDDIFDGV